VSDHSLIEKVLTSKNANAMQVSHTRSKLKIVSVISRSGLISYHIFPWVGSGVILSGNIISLLDCFSSSSWIKKYRKGLMLIWHTTLWKICAARNGVTFSSKNHMVEDLVENIKVASWTWILAGNKGGPCLYYE
jgi:hypothetical protein